MSRPAYTPNPDFDMLLKRGELREAAFAQLLKGELSVEVKSSPISITTGNFFIEISDDGQGPTGLSITTAAYWALEYGPDRWVLLPTDDLRRITTEVQAERGVVRGGWEHRSVGVLVPLIRLLKP